MVDFIHCNRCMLHNPTARFILSSCFHIFCDKCAITVSNMCPFCKKIMKTVPIDNNLNQELKFFFADPVKILQEEMMKIAKIAEHQKNMADHLLHHLIKEKDRKKHIEMNINKWNKSFEKQKNELEQMTNWIKQAEQKITSQNDEINGLNLQIENLKREIENASNANKQERTTNSYITKMPQFQFIPPESDMSSIGRSSNSSFNLMSPLVSSPCSSFDNIPSSFDSKHVKKKNTTDNFSSVFNSICTPSRNIEQTRSSFQSDRTCFSLDNRNSSRNSSVERRESSLPLNSTIKMNEEYLSKKESRFPESVRELRRYASQPGVVTRKSIIPASYLELNTDF